MADQLTVHSGTRVAMLCGSVKPLFGGVDDYNEILTAMLCRNGIDAVPVDIGNWHISQLPRLLREVAAVRPDAILMQYPTEAFRHSLLPQAFATVQTIAPLILTLHEFVFSHVLRRAAVGALVLRAASVVTTAETEAQALQRWYPWVRRRLRIIPIASNIPGRAWQPDPVPRVVSFGQIRPAKGLEEFLACHDALQPRFPGVRFVMIGSMVPQWAAYFAHMRAQCENRGIALLSGLSDVEVARELSHATLAVLPIEGGASLRRGSVLAASVCGLPIAALTGADTPAALRAILPQADTLSQLIEQSAEILTDQGARQAAHERSVRIAALVGWDRIAARFVEVIDGLQNAASEARRGTRQ
jgi:glycosyltransferase involved in cell wall biosynthesis